MFVEHVMDELHQVNITAENAKGDPLAQGTDYEAKPSSTIRPVLVRRNNFEALVFLGVLLCGGLCDCTARLQQEETRGNVEGCPLPPLFGGSWIIRRGRHTRAVWMVPSMLDEAGDQEDASRHPHS